MRFPFALFSELECCGPRSPGSPRNPSGKPSSGRIAVSQPLQGQQRQAKVADPGQQAMQRGLVRDQPGEHGDASPFVGDFHPRKVIRPFKVDVISDPDLEPS